MKWISAIGRGIRDLWLIVGMILLLLLLSNALLDNLLDTPEPARVVPGGSAPNKWSAEFLTDASWVDVYRDEFRASRKLRWEPYVYWRRVPFEGTHINVDELGRRATWQAGVSASAPVIWVFGGSTIWGSGSRDDHTIPSALARYLSDAGAPARVVNLGERGWVRGQALFYLQRLLSEGDKPDLVIFYDGANDVFADGIQGAEGSPQNERNRHLEFRAASNIPAWLRAGLSQMEGLRKLLAAEPAEPNRAVLEATAVAITERYAAQYAQLQSLADQYEFTAIAAWQPVIFSRKTLSEFEQRVVDASLRQHRDLHLMTAARIQESTWSQEDSFMDLSDLLDDTTQPVYMDFCHVSEAANAIIAEKLAAKALTLLRQIDL